MSGKTVLSNESAQLRMAALCARSEQCEADIRQRLYRLGLSPADVQRVVENLIRGGFVDNVRFAKAFANDKCRFSSWGRNKIRVSLMAKRIPSAVISEALEGIDPAEYAKALERTIGGKARTLVFDGPDWRENVMKLFRHVVSRGFESELASGYINRFVKIKGGG